MRDMKERRETAQAYAARGRGVFPAYGEASTDGRADP